MSFFKLLPALPLVLLGCTLKLDAGKLRMDPIGSAAGSGTTVADGGAGGAAVAGAGGATDSGAGAGTVGQAGTNAWSGPELARLGFALLGTAEVQPDGVFLTHDVASGEVGGLVYREQVGLEGTPLHVALGFRMQASGKPGDGLAVVLHASPMGYKALGGGGGGMGYKGLAPCFAVELDLAQQTPTDTPIPHIGFVPGCDNEVHAALEPVRGNPSDGADWLLTVDWDPKTTLLAASLQERDTAGNRTTLSRPTDLVGLLGPSVFVAITAGTGELRSAQSVRSLEISGGALPVLRIP